MQINRFSLLILPAACASLALAACGEGDPSSDSLRDKKAEFREASLRYAQCMRRHGVDMPDPSAGEGGMVFGSPAVNDNAPAFERAQEACQKHLESVRPPELSEEEEAELRERALRHARCMREHGVDMPDPTFGDGGKVQMRIEGGVDPESPAFQEAERECGGPGGRIKEGS